MVRYILSAVLLVLAADIVFFDAHHIDAVAQSFRSIAHGYGY